MPRVWLATSLLCLTVASGCASRNTGVKPPPVQAGLPSLIAWAPSEAAYADRTLSVDRNPFDLEIVSTVVPPGANASCPNGRAFVSFSGTSVIAPFECLDDPRAPACASAGGVRPAPFAAQGSMPVYTAEHELGGAICMPSATRTQPRYEVAGTDTDGVRTPTSVLQIKAYYERVGNDAHHECAVQTPHAVNFVRRSTDCGNSWTYSNAIDGTPLHDESAAGNADLPFLYYDRTTRDVFLLGHTGDYGGGVNTALVWRSRDDGRTWLPLPGSRLPADLKSLTSVGDAMSHALVAFACQPSTHDVNDGTPLVVVSYDDGDSWDRVPEGVFANAPKCGCLATSANERTATYMPGHTGSWVGNMTNAIAYREGVAPGAFEVRLAYSWLEPDSTARPERPRQALQYGVLQIPAKRGSLAASRWRGGQVLRPTSPDDSIFRATLTQPWVAAPVAPGLGADTAILWWIEARPGDQTHASSYRVVSGQADFGPPRPLSAVRAGPSTEPVHHRWQPRLHCGAIDDYERGVRMREDGRLLDKDGRPTPGYWWCFAGDYDRGTAWIDDAGRMRFFHTWAESHSGVVGASYFLHYNQVIVTPLGAWKRAIRLRPSAGEKVGFRASSD